LIKEELKKYSWLNLFSLLFLLVTSISLQSCEEKTYLPKPRSFPKVEYPNRNYSTFDKADCSFSFQVPSYFEYTKKTFVGDQKVKSPCWFDLNVPPLNGSLHCTYSSVNDREQLIGLINDSYELAEKHMVKANYIDDPLINTESVQGRQFEIHGPTATSFQFFLTDSIDNYFQASLYFNNPPNPDSMKPVVDFVRDDIQKMIETFAFEK